MKDNVTNQKRTRVFKNSSGKKPISSKQGQKRPQQEIEKLKQQMEFILGSTKTGLDIIDSNFNLLYIDPEWQKVYGNPNGKKCFEYFMDRSEVCPGCGIMEALKTKKTVVSEEVLVKENNRPIQVTTIPFQNEKGEWLVAEVNVDISERKRAEEALKKAQEELEIRVKERTEELALANEALQADITERRRAGEALRTEKQRFQTLSENAPFAMVTIDKDGTFKYLNRKFIDLFGYDLNDVPNGKEWFRRAYPDPTYRHQVVSVWINDLKISEPGEKRNRTFTVTCKDGSKKIINFIPVQLKTGENLMTCEDITEHKRAEEALRESEEKYRVLVENANEAILVAQDGMLKFTNPKASEIIGYSKEELCAMPFTQFIHGEDRGVVIERHLKRLQGERLPDIYPFRIVDKQGNIKWVEINAVLIDWEDRPATLNFVSDITERRRAEEEIKHTLSLLNATLESTADGILVVDREGKIASFNRKFAQMWHIPESIIVSRDDDQALAFVLGQLKDPEGFLAKVRELYNQPAVESFDLLEFKDRRVFERYSQPQWIGEQIAGRVWSFRDGTERKRAEEALRESEERYRTILENIEDGYYEVDLPGDLTFFNDSLCKMLGYSKDEMIGMSNKQYTDEENRNKLFQAFNEVYRTGEPTKGFDWEVIAKDGTKLFGEVSVSLIKDLEGRPCGFRGIARDVTERKHAEAALRTEKQRFETLLENAPFGVIMIDKEGNFKYVNSKFIELFGYDLKDIPNGREWFRKAYPDPEYRHSVIETWINDSNISESGENVPRIFTAACKDGTKKIIRFITVKLEKGEYLMSCEDITLIQRAEEEKAALEEQLRQSQRMEAIGRLAGGIAHDFNNLLTVIRGYSQLSLLEIKEDDKLRGNIEEIQKATQRATDLTRQLLAFGRRQIMNMKVIDLNLLIRELDKMLRRVIGEDIELVTILAEDLGRIKADPGQIEQVIINLAVNARDAMSEGGKLTIKTQNMEIDEDYVWAHVGVTSGSYAMLSITDTGCGMTPEVKGHLFEPFFTTKEIGKGTGLGLSTVYGIVKQSRGNIWTYSEPGKGTTFKIYLPWVDEPLKERSTRVLGEESPRGHETVLTVEDEEEVRKLAVQMLKRQGYAVFEASHGEEAMRVARDHAQEGIDLLLTDVVMPGMSGRELSEKLGFLLPKMKVLYMSGYTDDAIVRHGVLEEGVNYLQKPFTLNSLARKVRDVLDQ